MCKISIIVPVYNINQYLSECVDSIRNQTMKDIEIVLVDDGSTDGSSEICDQYASADSRIRVLHKTNEGLSAARNDGIKMARADYIMFADGDDWVDPCFCELPYQAAMEHDVEVVCFRYNIVLKNGKRIKSNPQGKGVIPEGDILALKQIESTAWSKLFKKKLFDNTFFPIGRAYEDIATIHRLLHSANGIYLLDQHLYYYRFFRPDSISETTTQKNMEDHFWALSSRFKDFEDWGIDMSDERYMMALNHLIKYGRKTTLSNHWLATLCKDDHLPVSMTWKQKAALSLYHINPFAFDIACTLTGRRKTIIRH